MESALILLNDFKRQWEDIGASAVEGFSRFGKSGWYILGGELASFEEALAEHWQLRHAVGVGNGLEAIQIALQATGCKPGDRVLTTPLSAFATTLAILRLGATPVFVDIDSWGLIDLDLAERVLESYPDIRYMVPVHLFGHACDLERLTALRQRFGITIIEDCAQSVCATWKGTATGTVGQIATTSFYPTKNLGALGDGGAILTDSDEFQRLARSLRDYGQTSKYKHDFVGYNSRLDELHAAFLLRIALPRLPAWTARRKEIAGTYLTQIRHDSVRSVGQPEHSNSSWHLFPILVDPERRQDFRRHMHEMGVQTGEHYPIAIPDQGALRGMRIEVPVELSRTAKFCKSEVSVPIHPYLTNSDVDAVVTAINAWKC